jgi:type III secretion system low calcium response chaperone LcrH/SycD
MNEKPDDLWDKVQECLDNAARSLAHIASSNVAKKKEIANRDEKKMEKEIAHSLQPIVQRMEKGVTKILELLTTSSIQEMDSDLLSEKLTDQLCQFAAIASVLAEHPQEYFFLLTHNKTLEEIFGISDVTIEALYQAAKHLYEQQHYGEAAAAFSVLCVLCPRAHTFWIGLGNSEYFSENYDAALIAYAMSIQAEPRDPTPHFFCARCYEKKGQREFAINALELALIAIGNQEQYASWKQKVAEHKSRLSIKE